VVEKTISGDHPGLIPGEYVMLSVSDNGKGMDSETLAHLFEPFYTTKEMDKGTGLGLATIYGVVKQNNGTIEVASQLGRGATFSVYLPRVEAQAAPVVIPDVKVLETPRGRAETLLLVEDEEALLDLEKDILEGLGYKVLAASRPADALRLAQEHGGEIELLITDVVMPGMNGRALAEKLYAIKPGLKCLFMSGYTADIITNHGVLPEGINFIQKPFSLNEFGVRVRQAIENK
jgi:two-component system cell cycle sensor histidine kinase/response regulator CckA